MINIIQKAIKKQMHHLHLKISQDLLIYEQKAVRHFNL